MDELWQTFSGHLLGIFEVIKCMKRNRITLQPWAWQLIEGFWVEALSALYWRLTQNLLFQEPLSFTKQVGRVCRMLNDFHREWGNIMNAHQLHESRWLIGRIEIFLRYYFAYYLSLLNCAGEESVLHICEVTKRRWCVVGIQYTVMMKIVTLLTLASIKQSDSWKFPGI